MSEIDTSAAAVESWAAGLQDSMPATAALLRALRAECDSERQRADVLALALSVCRDVAHEQAQRADAAEALAERLKTEAQVHAQEARTQRATVHECYQAVGAQKGDWNGAQPVREAIARLEAEVARLRAQVAQVKAETWREAANFLCGEGQPGYAEHCEARATEAQGGGR